jgi:hypothetical protein
MYAVVADFSRVLYRPIPAPGWLSPAPKQQIRRNGHRRLAMRHCISEQAIVGISGIGQSSSYDNRLANKELHQQQAKT